MDNEAKQLRCRRHRRKLTFATKTKLLSSLCLSGGQQWKLRYRTNLISRDHWKNNKHNCVSEHWYHIVLLVLDYKAFKPWLSVMTNEFSYCSIVKINIAYKPWLFQLKSSNWLYTIFKHWTVQRTLLCNKFNILGQRQKNSINFNEKFAWYGCRKS